MKETQVKYGLQTVKQQTVDVVAKRIAALEQNGELHLPTAYSPQNALKSAWLILQEILDKDKKPVLTTCTQTSIMNSLLDMVIMGLNPAKHQCYFIAYGKQLNCQRSYFGDMALAKRVDERIADIAAEIVYQGDEFKYELSHGKKTITEHKQTLESVNGGDIIGAYCVAYDHSGNAIKTEIMSFSEIKQSWKKSKAFPVLKDGSLKQDSVHADFTAEMCKRTVTRRLCKPIINSSSDQRLMAAITRSDFVQAEEESEQEIQEHANADVIDVEDTDQDALSADEELDAIINEEEGEMSPQQLFPSDGEPDF